MVGKYPIFHLFGGERVGKWLWSEIKNLSKINSLKDLKDVNKPSEDCSFKFN